MTTTTAIQKQKKRKKRWFSRSSFLRPSFFVALASILVYWDDTALHGHFGYDDDGSIRQNPIVNGRLPWTNVWTHDFWGTPLKIEQSHKSFRPITTLSFLLNWYFFPIEEEEATKTTDQLSSVIRGEDRTKGTYSFHVVNVILHGIVSGLVTEASAFVFRMDNNNSNSYQNTLSNNNHPTTMILAQLVTGFVFGLHPVHAEAVSNITSRGELLMSFFLLLAFLSYAHQISPIQEHPQKQQQQQQQQQSSISLALSISSLVAIYVIPWICMILSLLSKEQGASTLLALVLYDFIHHYDSLVHFLQCLRHQQQAQESQQSSSASSSPASSPAWSFLRRASILGIQTLIVCAWRYSLNGTTQPDFIFDQNPAGFAVDRFTRAFSVSWVYCLYIYDALYPQYLSIDWSGRSIPLIVDGDDPRIPIVVALWTVLAFCFATMIVGIPFASSSSSKFTQQLRYYRRVVLQSVMTFLVCPFLLSSNLFVTVGLMKGDRVIYLPLMGFCLLEGAVIQYACSSSTSNDSVKKQQNDNQSTSWMANLCHTILMLQLLFFCRKVHERNIAWSDPLRLWMSAYQVNPYSYHTIYNCGYNLSLQQRYEEAEQVLRPIRSSEKDGTTTTFVYAMVLYNLERCDEALPLLDRALEIVEERREEGGVRNTSDQTARAESNLLVAKAFCTDDIRQKGKALYQAVQVDPTNDYAVGQAKILNDLIERGLDVDDSALLKHILSSRKG